MELKKQKLNLFEIILSGLPVQKTITLNSQVFLTKHKLKVQFILYILNFQKKFSDKRFVNIDDGLTVGTHWTAFYVKNSESFYFDAFGGQLDDFVLKQSPKLITYSIYKVQDKTSGISGSYCLYFFYLFERVNYYDVNSKKISIKKINMPSNVSGSTQEKLKMNLIQHSCKKSHI